MKKYNSVFQTRLNKDTKSLHSSEKTVTFANETTNLYRLTKEEHEKFLQNAVTSKFKKLTKS